MKNSKFEEDRTNKNLSSDRKIKIRSISMRLTVSLIITVAIVSVIAIAVIYLYEVQEAEKELGLKADDSIAYLTGTIKMPLWHLALHTVRMIGKTVSQDELIAKLTITDSFDSIIYSMEEEEARDSMEKEERADLISRSGKIYHNGDVIGEVRISLTKKFYKESNRRLLFSFAFATLIILGTLVLVTGFLMRTLLRKPLNSLDEIVSSYASGVYDSSDHSIPYLEFKSIGNVLAQMGDKIIEQLKDIREAEEKYRGIVNNAVMGVYQITEEGKFLLANPSMARMFGFKSPEELLTSVPNISQFYVHPEDRAPILLHMKTKGFVDGVEIQFRGRDKETIWVSASARIVKDKPGETIYEGFMLDITDRKQAEEEIKKHQDHLEELVEERTTELRIINEELEREIDERKKAEEAIHNSEQRLSDIIDFLPDATFVIDKDGRVILWNRAMEELTGVKTENMLGKGDHEYAIPLYGERRPILIDQLSRIDKRIVKEYLLFREEEDTLFSESYHPDLRPGGAYLSGAAHSLYDTKGEVIGAIESVRDITWRKETEKELTEANIRLQELDQLKSMFLASMSHELRTPLNSIIGFISWILMGMEGDLNEEQTKQLAMAKNSADHLLSLVNDILDISKIESGKLDLSIEEFEIAEVVKDVAAAVLPQAKNKGLELHVDVTEKIKLKSDTQRLKQVLLNLVSNAVKFTDHGKIKIRAEASGTDNLEIIVLDKGIGIREEDMAKLFQPFQQIDMSYTKEHQGTGLGLYLCKKLLNMLHGDISVKSEFGKGSEFKVTLPLKPSLSNKEESDIHI